jgi:hypothetical protein
MTSTDAPEGDDPTPLDPKEQMRLALEAKRAGEHASGSATEAQRSSGGGPHGKVGGKRQFRRKSGG